MSKQKTSLAPIISTIVVAVLALAVAIFAIILITGEDNASSGNTPTGGGTSVSVPFSPTQELVDECTYAAHDLVAANYKVVRLFITEGLDHLDEPYGNLPEDGYYTVDSTAYKTLEDISSLLTSVYTAEEAERILTNVNGSGLQVYKDREKLVKVEETYEGTAETTAEPETSTGDGSVQYKTEYVLGISADFAPAEDYAKDWSSCRIAVTPISETECSLKVYLDGVSPETATEDDAESILDITMLKSDGGWRLTSFAY